jgi:O-antigen ligase
MGSVGDKNQPAPSPDAEEVSSPSRPTPATGVSWLGLPRFRWSLTLLGLCVFTFSILTYRLPVGQIGIATAAVGLLLQPGKLRVTLPVWLYGAFVLWAFVASFASPYANIARDEILESLKLLVIMLIAVNAFRTEGQVRFYLLFFLGCFVLYPLRGALLSSDDYFGRAVWSSPTPYANPNNLALICLVALGVTLGLVFTGTSRSLMRLCSGIIAILLLVVILLTQSRGGFIGLVVGMGPAFVWSGVKRPVRMLLVAGVLAVVIGLAVPVTVWERLSGIGMLTDTATIALADPFGSAEQRFEIQKVGWQIFLDNPVFGVGLGAYPEANAAYDPSLGRRDAHNSYLKMAAEVGLPGLAIWSVTVWAVLRFAYRSRRLAAPGELATQQAWIERALWGYLVAGMFGAYAATIFSIMLAVLWSSAMLLLPSLPAPGTATRVAEA